MAQLVRCKSCGFITWENKVGDVCPACGVPKKMLEPFKSDLSEKRRKILDTHIHPIIVHFPQAFAFTCLVLAVLPFIFSGSVRLMFFCSLKVVGVILPFTAAGAILTGLFDGKTRFRKVTTPILKIKIIFGSLFFAASTVLCVLILATNLTGPLFLTLGVILSAVCFVASLVLGKLGAGLLNARFPG